MLSKSQGREGQSPGHQICSQKLPVTSCGATSLWLPVQLGVKILWGAEELETTESIQFPKNLGSEITVTPAQIPRTILFLPPSLPTLKHIQSISKSCRLTLQNNHSFSISSRHQPSPRLQSGSDNTDPVSPHLSHTYARHCAQCWQYVYVLKRDLQQPREAGQGFLGQACLKQNRWLTGETGPFHSHGVVYAITEEETKAGLLRQWFYCLVFAMRIFYAFLICNISNG